MKIQEIKGLAVQEKSNLFAIIDENQIHSSFMKDLIIFEEQQHNPMPSDFRSETYKVFKAVNNLQSFGRKKRCWYTMENMTELKEILLSYPNSHHII